MVAKKRKRSKVYAFVEELHDANQHVHAIKCRYCPKVWIQKPRGDGNTSNIAKHLWSKHKIEVPGIDVKGYGKNPNRQKMAEQSEGNVISPANGRPITHTPATQATLQNDGRMQQIEEGMRCVQLQPLESVPVDSIPIPVEEEAEPDPKQPNYDLDSSTSLSSTPQKLDETGDRQEVAQVVDADTTEVINEDGIEAGDPKAFSQVVEKFFTPHIYKETVVKGVEELIPTVVETYNVEVVRRGVGVPLGIVAPKASDQKVGEELSLLTHNFLFVKKSMLSGKVESCSDVSAEMCSGVNGEELPSPGDQHLPSADSADLSLVGAEAMDEVEDSQQPEAVDNPAFCYPPSASRDNCEEVENDSPPLVLDSPDTNPGTTLAEASDGNAAHEVDQFPFLLILKINDSNALFKLVSFHASGDRSVVGRPNQPLLERTANRGGKFGELSPEGDFFNGESVGNIWDERLEPCPVKRRKKSESTNGGERQLPASPAITAVDRPPEISLSQRQESLQTDEDVDDVVDQRVALAHSADTPCLPAGEPPDTRLLEDFSPSDDLDDDLLKDFSLPDILD